MDHKSRVVGRAVPNQPRLAALIQPRRRLQGGWVAAEAETRCDPARKAPSWLRQAWFRAALSRFAMARQPRPWGGSHLRLVSHRPHGGHHASAAHAGELAAAQAQAGLRQECGGHGYELRDCWEHRCAKQRAPGRAGDENTRFLAAPLRVKLCAHALCLRFVAVHKSTILLELLWARWPSTRKGPLAAAAIRSTAAMNHRPNDWGPDIYLQPGLCHTTATCPQH